MSIWLKKPSVDGHENLSSTELEQGKINEVRRLLGNQSDKLSHYCSDACIARYLRARNWNVKKAVKMLEISLKWRTVDDPEKICWDDVAKEAETGKIYCANYRDKYGRSVIVMRPRCQNSKSVKEQIKYLIYCMENAIMNLPKDQEQMVWLIDFQGFSVSNISVKATRETAYVLQEQYPERLGVAILYNPPKIFEPFWTIAKPFLEPKTVNKVKFVYSDDVNTSKIMNELFNMELVESAFGGKDNSDFDINKYAERMREDDKKSSSLQRMDDNLTATSPTPPLPTSSFNASSSSLDSDASDGKVNKSLSTWDEDFNATVSESVLVKQ